MKLPSCKKLMKDPVQLVHFFREYHPAMVKLSLLYAEYRTLGDSRIDFAKFVKDNLDKF